MRSNAHSYRERYRPSVAIGVDRWERFVANVRQRIAKREVALAKLDDLQAIVNDVA